MTDRELLERAAKAAGLTIEYWAQDDYPVVRDGTANIGWNPLTFDSDALRLAVHTGEPFVVRPGAVTTTGGLVQEFNPSIEGDDLRAVRRIIVRAAAAIRQGGA